MTQRPIGYYVHHHGAGHMARARAIAAASDWPIVLLGTGISDAGVDLADDRLPSGDFDGVDAAGERPLSLHYAPIDHDGIRSRVARITRWIADESPAIMVVDVSVEVAMLARLASVPTVYVRLNGDRSDRPHLDAFRGALALLAPFARDMDMPSIPAWIRDKTHYSAGITATTCDDLPNEKRILIVIGRGGPVGDSAQIAQAARACPDLHWRVIGPVTPSIDHPVNLEFLGWVDNAEREIARAAVVIGAAGDGLIGAVLAANRPFICLPQDRPYDEQKAAAHALEVAKAAIILPHWPSPERWPSLIAAARALPDDARKHLHDPRGAHKTAAWLATLVPLVARDRLVLS